MWSIKNFGHFTGEAVAIDTALINDVENATRGLMEDLAANLSSIRLTNRIDTRLTIIFLIYSYMNIHRIWILHNFILKTILFWEVNLHALYCPDVINLVWCKEERYTKIWRLMALILVLRTRLLTFGDGLVFVITFSLCLQMNINTNELYQWIVSIHGG